MSPKQPLRQRIQHLALNVNSSVTSFASATNSFRLKHKKLILSFLLTLLRDFFLAYGVRGSIRFIPLLFKSIQQKNFTLSSIIAHSFGRDVGRFGLFVSLYFSSFKVTEQLISYWRKGRRDRWNALVAGAVSSFSLIVMREDESFRWTLAQYLAMRAAQCLYNHLIRAQPQWKRFFYFGDVGLFSFASAQLMYGYFVRPETLDTDYRRFVERFSGVNERLIACNREGLQKGGFDTHDLLKLSLTLQEVNESPELPSELQSLLLDDTCIGVPCSVLHHQCGCLSRILGLWLRTLRQSAPMYLSLHLIPSLLFKFPQFIKDPSHQFLHSIRNTLQSSCFLATSAAAFQSLICAKSFIFDGADWKYSYWLMGALAGTGILIEKKPRRSELALYLLPKALQALYRAMIDRKLMFPIPRGDFLLFSFSMAVLMSYYRDEPESVTPIVSKIFQRFL